MKAVRALVYYYLRFIGLKKKHATLYTSVIHDDLRKTPVNLQQKIWAYRRGFLSSRIDLYGLHEKNYKDYLSDIDYQRYHPYNNHFAFWINDKLTLKYMLQGLDPGLMPEYYLYIENDGKYSYLMDAPHSIPKNRDFVFNLLLQKKILALKPSRGHGGVGFIKLTIEENSIFVNGEHINKNELLRMFDKLNGYLVTEWCSQHKELDKIFSDTVCTLRIVALKNKQKEFYNEADYSIIVSYARFGTKKSKGASNLSSGGVGVSLDFETGKLGQLFYRHKNYKVFGNFSTTLSAHPDTGYAIKEDDYLPLHEDVKKVVYKICRYLSSLDYFGFDIIVTQTGVKIVEINSKPGLNVEQALCGPINKNPAAVDFFTRKGIPNLQLRNQ